MFALLDRLFLFLVVLSAVRSAVLFLYRLWSGSQSRSPQRTAAAPNPAPRGPATTLLHQDPVCGTYVGGDTSLKKIVGGKVVHFCSEECRGRYSVSA